jgi:hypothetical protein
MSAVGQEEALMNNGDAGSILNKADTVVQSAHGQDERVSYKRRRPASLMMTGSNRNSLYNPVPPPASLANYKLVTRWMSAAELLPLLVEGDLVEFDRIYYQV